MHQGWVVGLRIHPLKSARAINVPTVEIEPSGPAGDRRWMLVDPDGRFVSQRRHPFLATVVAGVVEPDSLQLVVAGRTITATTTGRRRLVTVWKDRVPVDRVHPATNDELSGILGFPVELVRLDRSGSSRSVDPDFAPPDTPVSLADGFPVLLTSETSRRDLQDSLGRPVDMTRFRANIIIDGAPAWGEENCHRLTIGAVRFLNPKSCRRCSVVDVDQHTGTRAREELLRGVFAERPGGNFGTNLLPVEPGTIRRGDPVELE